MQAWRSKAAVFSKLRFSVLFSAALASFGAAAAYAQLSEAMQPPTVGVARSVAVPPGPGPDPHRLVGPSLSPRPFDAVSALQSTAPRSTSQENKSSLPKEYERDAVARWLGGIGISLSLVALLFNLWKAHSDRRFSIEDDFWFRKVVTPFSIEPLLKDFRELLEKVPRGRVSQGEARDFAVLTTQTFQRISVLVEMLELFEFTLPAKVNEALRECEDVLTDYSATLTESANHAAVKQLAWKKLRRALMLIKNSQVRKGRIFNMSH